MPSTNIYLDIYLFVFMLLTSLLFNNFAVLAVFIALWLLIQIFNPKKIYYLLILAMPFSYVHYPKPSIGNIVLNIDDILLSLIISYFIWYYLFNPGRVAQIPDIIKKSIFLIIAYSSMVFMSTVATSDSLGLWITSISQMFTFLTTILVISDKDRFDVLINLLKIAILCIGISIILDSFNMLPAFLEHESTKKSAVRALLESKYASSGLMSSRGSVGVAFSFVIPFLIHSIVKYIKIRHILGVKGVLMVLSNTVTLIIIGLAIILTASRSTWLMGISTVISLFLLMNFRGYRLMMMLTFLIFTALLFQYQIEKRVIDLYKIQTESVDSRIQKNINSLEAIPDSIPFGILNKKLLSVGGINIDIHNFFLKVLIDHGLAVIPILFLFYYAIYSMYSLFTLPNETARTFGACLISGFVGMMTELNSYGGGEKHMWVYLALFIVSSTIMQHQLENTGERSS